MGLARRAVCGMAWVVRDGALRRSRVSSPLQVSGRGGSDAALLDESSRPAWLGTPIPRAVIELPSGLARGARRGCRSAPGCGWGDVAPAVPRVVMVGLVWRGMREMAWVVQDGASRRFRVNNSLQALGRRGPMPRCWIRAPARTVSGLQSRGAVIEPPPRSSRGSNPAVRQWSSRPARLGAGARVVGLLRVWAHRQRTPEHLGHAFETNETHLATPRPGVAPRRTASTPLGGTHLSMPSRQRGSSSPPAQTVLAALRRSAHADAGTS